jgi:hypothetical protein
MRVKDLQQFLHNFTSTNYSGSKQGNAISEAVLFVEKDGFLHEIRRMEVQEHAIPLLGHPGQTAHRLVLKTQKHSRLIVPTKLKNDY